MFEIVLKVLLIVFLGSIALVALALALGISLACGYLMGLLVNVLFHVPMWLAVSFFTVFFAISLIGPLLGWWEVRRRSWAPTLAALWMFDKMTDRLSDLDKKN